MIVDGSVNSKGNTKAYMTTKIDLNFIPSGSAG